MLTFDLYFWRSRGVLCDCTLTCGPSCPLFLFLWALPSVLELGFEESLVLICFDSAPPRCVCWCCCWSSWMLERIRELIWIRSSLAKKWWYLACISLPNWFTVWPRAHQCGAGVGVNIGSSSSLSWHCCQKECSSNYTPKESAKLAKCFLHLFITASLAWELFLQLTLFFLPKIISEHICKVSEEKPSLRSFKQGQQKSVVV